MSDNEKEQQENSTLPSLVADLESGDGATIYKYRDFSNVAEEDEIEQQPSSSKPPSTSSRGSMESSIRVQKFPAKLYAILAQKEFQDIIAWLPHGRSWKILRPNLFESLVMPLFFEYSNYNSFNRLVNAWSFRRISSSPDRGSYYHEVSYQKYPGRESCLMFQGINVLHCCSAVSPWKAPPAEVHAPLAEDPQEASNEEGRRT
jgi:hypothetical protein